jgi:prolyl oligopeptidase
MKNLTRGALMVAIATSAVIAQDDDPYIWLEEVEGKEALEWVEERNKHSLGILEGDSRFKGLMDRALKDYNATDKIAYGSVENGEVHNFWQDATNVRGLWRKTTLESYASDNPVWETVLDYDALAKSEGENWVYKGRDCLHGTTRCMIRLSRGGGDAVVVREFDTATKSFVDSGFESPEAKQNTAWLDADTLLIGTDFGDGTMNESGYARQVRVWKRGTSLSDAALIHDSAPEIVFNFPMASHRGDGQYAGVIQGPDFFTQVLYLMNDEGKLQKLDLPLGIDFQGFFGDQMIILMRKGWETGGKSVAAGSLVSVKVSDLLAGNPANSLTAIFTPGERNSIDGVSIGRDRIFLSVLDEVTGQLISATHSDDGWATSDMGMPKNGTLAVTSADEWSDNAMVNFESFLQPDTLYHVSASTPPKALKSLPSRFDATDLVTTQKFATSKDGTKVPYFLVHHKDVKMDGATPTVLYGYGGFEISLTPGYLAGFSKLWVESGGAYAVANIRGGGEFGPKWHQAALKPNRQRAFDDFISVAEDLIASKLTSPKHLGIRGGSNGGLLMGATFTQRPELFNAAITAVPLLDMIRYHKLLAGASWVGEYGDPDIPEEREFILKYSPYQNVKKDGKYPEIFFYTSTKDDRVHPGHARKMAARMMEQGHPIIYYENTEGGHAAAANLKQRAFTDALQTVYVLKKLAD